MATLTRRDGAPLLLALSIALTTALAVVPSHASHTRGNGVSYTTDADFQDGSFINTVVDQGSIRLDDTTKPFPFIWVAVSTKGTTVKIDTRTGAIVGEYYTSPAGRSRDPSRTTVDKHGSVWVANRAEGGTLPANGLLLAGASGSMVHIGLEENGQCQDRNGNGVIDTSRGANDLKPWTNTGGADNAGGVTTAEDECVIHYTRVNSTGTRHVSVNSDNDVWVSGTGERVFDLVDGDTGLIIRRAGSVGYGGYGGLIDGNGVIWSTGSGHLLRWDTNLPLTAGNYSLLSGTAHYGLGIDPQGNVWNTSYGVNQIRKYAPSGALLGTFAQGSSQAQGVVAGANGDIWVAHALGGSTVGHLRNDGTYVGTISVGSGPTGVAIDAFGKVWSTNYNDGTVSRIDPALRGGVGELDLTTTYLGGLPYNYSDMTGSVLIGAPTVGAWTVIHDGGAPGNVWDILTWEADVPGDASLIYSVSTSEDGVSFGAPQVIDAAAAPSAPAAPLPPSAELTVPPGRYLQVRAAFRRGTDGASPSLASLSIGRRATALVATPAVADVRHPEASTVHFPRLSATLTEGTTGAPVEGRLVEFAATDVVDGTRAVICTATTDASGVASCSGTTEQELAYETAAIRGLGYDVTYAGDVVYSGSSARGQLVRVRVSAP